ncbi:MAG: hypothetical protein AAF731_21260 [Bacteroidota bacterium]
MDINKDSTKDKAQLLAYFRDRSDEILGEIGQKYGEKDISLRARKLNTGLVQSRKAFITTLTRKSSKEGWSAQEVLEAVLMVTYCNYVVMLENRNAIRPYEYMDFSRRIGELWEPFCKLCFEYPLNDLELFIPPLFSEVKRKLAKEIDDYIDDLSITDEQKSQLKRYYGKVWSLVTSGEIKLELDLHFTYEGNKYVVDFKSGFGSNEKGNTNRLLLVATIYHNMEENYSPLIFVRSKENNNYFNTLKNSGVWQAYSGGETYDQIKIYAGYDIRQWIDNNIDWENDLNDEMVEHLRNNNLLQYLVW